jgi:predicted metal-dependent hydrolase
MGTSPQLDLFSAGPVAPEQQKSKSIALPLDHALPIVRPPVLPEKAQWREVETPHQRIGFVLRRSRRKSIGLLINDDGLQITAAAWVPLAQIDAAVVEKSPWILRKLRARLERQEHLALAETAWQDGGNLPYLGRRILLSLDGSQLSVGFQGLPFAPADGDVLRLALPAQADQNRVRDAVHVWLQQQARAWFGQRLDHFLKENDLSMRRWRLSSAASRWGSCSSDGNIMLNWRLIHFEHAIIDYVIAHEIAHLRHMNHSKDFWQEVSRILPGFERSRDILRRHNPGTLPLI